MVHGTSRAAKHGKEHVVHPLATRSDARCEVRAAHEPTADLRIKLDPSLWIDVIEDGIHARIVQLRHYEIVLIIGEPFALAFRE